MTLTTGARPAEGAAADPFTARSADRRRSRRLRRLQALAAVLVVVTLGWVLLGSSLLGVRTVDVTGTSRTTVEQVVGAAGLVQGEPLARLDGAAVRVRVLAALPAVAGVTVQRSWPSTVRLTVAERVPVAAVPAEGGFALIDADGVRFATEPTVAPGLPLVTLDRASAADPTATAAGVAAALQVLEVLPAEVSGLLTGVSVERGAEVVLTLDAGRTVVWGPVTSAPGESARRAAAVRALLSTPGTVFDVSSPGLAVVR